MSNEAFNEAVENLQNTIRDMVVIDRQALMELEADASSRVYFRNLVGEITAIAKIGTHDDDLEGEKYRKIVGILRSADQLK